MACDKATHEPIFPTCVPQYETFSLHFLKHGWNTGVASLCPCSGNTCLTHQVCFVFVSPLKLTYMMTPAKTLRVQTRSEEETCSDEARALSCACFLFLIVGLGVRHNTTLVIIPLVISAVMLVTGCTRSGCAAGEPRQSSGSCVARA